MGERFSSSAIEAGIINFSQVNVTANDVESTDDQERASRARKAQIGQEVANQQSDKLAGRSAASQHLQDAMAGRFGPEVQKGAIAWAQSHSLQETLTPELRQKFVLSLQHQPETTAKAGHIMAGYTQHPGFQAAVAQPQAMDVVQQVTLQEPDKAKKMVESGMSLPAMVSPAVDNKAKKSLWNIWLGAGGQTTPSARLQTAQTLQKLGEAGVAAPGQQAAVEMMSQQGNTGALDTLDSFVGEAPIQSLPKQAKGAGVQMLALTLGDRELSSSLVKLAGADDFKAQDPMVQARWFATIASGKPSAFRGLTDGSLALLRHDGFTTGYKDVPRLLRVLGEQAKRGASEIHPGVLLEQAEALAPTVPNLVAISGLSGPEKRQGQIANIAKINAYLHAASKFQQRLGEQIKQAKTPEALRQIQLEGLGELDLSGIEPAMVDGVHGKIADLQQDLRQLQRNKRNRYLDLGLEPPPALPSNSRSSKAQGVVAESARTSGVPLPLPARGEPEVDGAGSKPGWVIMGRTDAWGIQRTFERDLGAGTLPQNNGALGKSNLAAVSGGVLAQISQQVATNVKPQQATVRNLLTLWPDVSWKQLTKGERAALSNLGWRQQAWDVRHNGQQHWPATMAAPFAELATKGRQAVLALGYTGASWDDQIRTMQ